MGTPRRLAAPGRSGSTSGISRCRGASTSASAWDSDHETYLLGTLDRRPGVLGRMYRLPRRQYEPERPAVGIGESVPTADAALVRYVSPIRRPLRWPLHAGVVFHHHERVAADDVGQDGLRPGQR